MQLPAAEGRAFEVQAAPLRVAGGRGAIAILHDITDLERLERVRKDFVANVSHELRTPLTAIRGYTETLLEGALEDQENNRKFLEIIKNHSIRLNSIASDLLALSELESGKGGAEQARVSVRAAIEAALRAVEAEALSRRVKLIRGRVEEVEVFGERVRLEQALVNLLTNAVKFNRPDGEVRVEVTRTTTIRCASRSPITVSGFLRLICRAFSSDFIVSTRPVPGRWAAPAWDSPSLDISWSECTAG